MSTFHVFCDESHTASGKHAFRVQGGIWVPDEGMRDVRAALKGLRAKHPTIGELKWSYVTGKQPFTVYVDLMNLFFDSPVAKLLSFNCILVERGDDPARNLDKIGKDLGFYKAYYTLLHWRLAHGSHNYISLDERSSPRAHCEDELMSCLNNASASRHDSPYTVVTCRGVRSKHEDLIQLADVLCGVVGWAWNGMASTCGAKTGLHAHITKALGWATLRTSTSGRATKFNVWRYRPPQRK